LTGYNSFSTEFFLRSDYNEVFMKFRSLAFLILLSCKLLKAVSLESYDTPVYNEELELFEFDYDADDDINPDVLTKAAELNDDVDNENECHLSADCEPITTVGGCVNLLSGSFFQMERDLKSNSIEPLDVLRSYDSSSKFESMAGFGFSTQFPLWASETEKSIRHYNARISEREGAFLPYRGSISKNQGRKILGMDPRMFKKGTTNLSHGVIGGTSNFVNWCAVRNQASEKTPVHWKVQLGDGTLRYYTKSVYLSTNRKRRMNFLTKDAYLLTKEIKSNGNKLLYSYDKIEGEYQLKQIQSVNRSETAVLDELTFNHRNDGCIIQNRCGNSVEYQLQDDECVFTHAHGKKKNRRKLQEVRSSLADTMHFETIQDKKLRRVSHIKKPNGQFIEVHYNAHGNEHVKYKVNAIIEPRGKDNQPIKTFKFSYDKRFTSVKNAIGDEDRYAFDEYYRLHKKSYMIGNHVIRNDVFEWNNREVQRGWLQSKGVQQGTRFFHKTEYQYDWHGNVITETLFGNITGKHSDAFENKSHTDHHVKTFKYSEDRRNLLLEKTTHSGVITQYNYRPRTNLCNKELVSYLGKIQERRFCDYDENGQIIKMIEDDGSGEDENDLTDVIARKIVTIETCQNQGTAYFGKPKLKVTSYYDPASRCTRILNKTEYSYDSFGNEESKRYYDSNNNFCYAITKQYDRHQNLIEETDPLGNTTCYKYNNANQLVRKHAIQGGEIFSYDYDAVGRLIAKKEEHTSGEVFETHYEYNGLDQKVAEIDRYGNTTTYEYDRLGCLKKCVKPVIYSHDGYYTTPTTSFRSNILGQMVEQTDENGAVTKYAYNIFGKPTKITHPDGSVERFQYRSSGFLKQHWNSDGTSIAYERDPQGKVTKQLYYDSNDNLIKQESFEYKGKYLISQTDAMGLKTTYQYDGCGRKIAENTLDGKRRVEYTYDDFGRLIQEFHALHDTQGQYVRYAYDWKDQVVSKSLQDDQGRCFSKIAMTYDTHGKTIEKVIAVDENSEASYRSEYDSSGAIFWKETPFGERTSWTYFHHHRNGINQQVQARHYVDPLGRIFAEVDDAFSRIARRDLSSGKNLLCEHFNYDAAGHLIAHHSKVMEDGQHIRDYEVKWKYNSRGLLESETEHPSGKTTQYDYDSCKRKSKMVKADGVSLKYDYDALGRIKQVASSDGSINNTYSYDLHDNPAEMKDHINGFELTRQYDLLNRMTSEQWSSGCSVQMDYDALDRMTRFTLPDGSYVIYEYDAVHLTQVHRFTKENELRYTCSCDQYDLRGHLLEMTTPAGITHMQYDRAGRMLDVKTAGWTLSLKKYDPVGNLLRLELEDPSGKGEGRFGFDVFDNLAEENLWNSNSFQYDSVGNCISKNANPIEINALNQVAKNDYGFYQYDLNGNLFEQSVPNIRYRYDAFHRLLSIESETESTRLRYDPMDRCIQIVDKNGIKNLFYQGDHEVGSVSEGRVREFRLMHPQGNAELVMAIEIDGDVFYPIQEHRFHITALRRPDGSLAQWSRYSAFDEVETFGDTSFSNPWRFGNRRQVAGLSLFKHRLYHPKLMRWMTQDPIGFADGLNCYQYVHNNPFKFIDPDGQFAWAIGFTVPLSYNIIQAMAAAVVGAVSAPVLISTVAVVAVGTATYCICDYYDVKPPVFGLAGTFVNLCSSGDAPAVAEPQPASPDSVGNRPNEDIVASETQPQQTNANGNVKNDNKKGRHPRIDPREDATGEHTVIKRDPNTKKVTRYETFRPQTNPRNPNPWESVKRYDNTGLPDTEHFNKALKEPIYEPHVHDPTCRGGVRPAYEWERP